ncbi:hypothetical protein AcW2_007447 [Taiwanofungus camphoratus]|nr:hypothetical protein AcW2_007447 [Antrodia cinnamomea]
MSLRQRIPFKLSENNEDTSNDRILDEQGMHVAGQCLPHLGDTVTNNKEQEEVIERLQTQSNTANNQYMLLCQVVIGLSCLLHFIFLLRGSKESPLFVLLPSGVPSPSIPAAPLFAVLHIILHLNLSLHLLPAHSEVFHSVFPSSYSFHSPSLPLLFSHPVTLTAPAVAPTLSLLLHRGWPDVAWWSIAGGMTLFVYSVQKWIRQSEEGIRELEGMRYNAKGA